jgi:tetratricopeptide (TPR) repeat protein
MRVDSTPWSLAVCACIVAGKLAKRPDAVAPRGVWIARQNLCKEFSTLHQPYGKLQRLRAGLPQSSPARIGQVRRHMFQGLRSLLALTLCSAGLCVGQSTDNKVPATVPVASHPQSAVTGADSLSKPPSPAAGAPDATSLTLKSANSAAAPDPLGEASSFYRKGNLTAAIEKYQQALQADPKSAAAYAGLARAYLKERNVDLASDTITKGRAVSDSPVLHVVLGELYFRQGKISEAEQEWVNLINSATWRPGRFWAWPASGMLFLCTRRAR